MVMIPLQINVSLVPGGDLASWQGQALGQWAKPHPSPQNPAGCGGSLGVCQALRLRS